MGRDITSWEEVNKISTTSFIPDASLHDACISTKLKEVESYIPLHLVDVFARVKAHISQREQTALGLLLIEYASVFSRHNRDLRKFTLTWQIEVDERDCRKTAFLTTYDLFEHVRMAQGLCNWSGDKTYAKLKISFFWPYMHSDCMSTVRGNMWCVSHE